MLSPFTSDKFRFWSFVSMALLVFVHGYNLDERYLQPWTVTGEALGWTGFIEYFLCNGLLRFRIPMLFLISGYLYALHDATPNSTRVKKRVRTLLVPYLLWSTLCLALFYMAESSGTLRDWISTSHIAQIDRERTLVHQYTWYEVLIRWLLIPLPYQLWFIRVLFFYNLMYPVLLRWVSAARSRTIFFSIAIVLWLTSLPFLLFEGEGLLCFALGVWIQKSGFDIAQPGRWLNPKWWGLVFVLTAAIKTWLAFDAAPWLGVAVYPLLVALHKLTVASGLVTAWFGSDAVVRWCMARRWFVWLASFSFIIYAVHAPWVAVAIDPALALAGNGPGRQMLVFVLLPLALIAFAVGLGALMRRWVPGVYGVLTGGRGM